MRIFDSCFHEIQDDERYTLVGARAKIASGEDELRSMSTKAQPYIDL